MLPPGRLKSRPAHVTRPARSHWQVRTIQGTAPLRGILGLVVGRGCSTAAGVAEGASPSPQRGACIPPLGLTRLPWPVVNRLNICNYSPSGRTRDGPLEHHSTQGYQRLPRSLAAGDHGVAGWLLAAMPGATAPPAPLGLAGWVAPLALSTPQVQVPALLFHPHCLSLQSQVCQADLGSHGGANNGRKSLLECLGITEGLGFRALPGCRASGWLLAHLPCWLWWRVQTDSFCFLHTFAGYDCPSNLTAPKGYVPVLS